MSAPYRVLVTGSRDDRRPRRVFDTLDELLDNLEPSRRLVVIHGACKDRKGRLRGVDAWADLWARRARAAGCPVDIEQYPAEQFGPWPACGPRRNRHMVARGADEALAFIGPCTRRGCPHPEPHGSHGATGCADLAQAAGIPVRRWTP